jgi:hypothetical protein
MTGTKGEEMKSSNLKSILTMLLLAGVTVTMAGCSSTVPTDTPGVERMGRFVLRQFGPELWTVLGYKFANSQISDEWMILEVGLSSPSGQSAKVTRGDVFLRTPTGGTIQLATQTQFNEAYAELRPVISRANVDRDPLDYFPPSREESAIRFFSTPGQGVVFEEVTVNDRRGCFGRLYFNVSGGIQTGRWTLGIDLPESEIRIPFELGE